ncbi:MAG: ATP synthase F1 subunit delta [Mycoplasmoidaceae bacterium]
MNNVIKHYSDALFELYLEDKNQNFFDNLKLLKSIIKHEHDLINLLSSLMLSKAERHDIINSIFKNKIDIIILNFLHILVENNNFHIIERIVKSTLAKIDKEEGICFATIESPFPLQKEQIEKIKLIISTRTKSKIELDFIINKSLIGGFKIIFGSEVIDGSIQYRLEQIRKKTINYKGGDQYD